MSSRRNTAQSGRTSWSSGFETPGKSCFVDFVEENQQISQNKLSVLRAQYLQVKEDELQEIKKMRQKEEYKRDTLRTQGKADHQKLFSAIISKNDPFSIPLLSIEFKNTSKDEKNLIQSEKKNNKSTPWLITSQNPVESFDNNAVFKPSKRQEAEIEKYKQDLNDNKIDFHNFKAYLKKKFSPVSSTGSNFFIGSQHRRIATCSSSQSSRSFNVSRQSNPSQSWKYAHNPRISVFQKTQINTCGSMIPCKQLISHPIFKPSSNSSELFQQYPHQYIPDNGMDCVSEHNQYL